MPKPPIESLLFQATRRMLGWLLILLFSVLIPTVGASLARQLFPAPLGVTGEAVPIPELGWTTDGAHRSSLVQVIGSIPDTPGPNQKRSGECDPKRSEVEINGGCWVQTHHPLPCPEGVQWEHLHRCWLPVAHAARTPTSGGSYPVNVADP